MLSVGEAASVSAAVVSSAVVSKAVVLSLIHIYGAGGSAASRRRLHRPHEKYLPELCGPLLEAELRRGRADAGLPRGPGASVSGGTGGRGVRAVSYTHLDVYKRQPRAPASRSRHTITERPARR